MATVLVVKFMEARESAGQPVAAQERSQAIKDALDIAMRFYGRQWCVERAVS